MGYQIIKQPDGRFALFSRYTETIAVYDATGPEVIDWFADRAAQDARVAAARQLGHVVGDHPEQAYHQFVVTWDEALAADRAHGGEAWKELSR